MRTDVYTGRCLGAMARTTHQLAGSAVTHIQTGARAAGRELWVPTVEVP